MSLTEILMSLERKFWTGSVEFYESNVAADCRMIFPGVGVMSREVAIQGVASGERWNSVEVSDVEIAEVSDGVALVSYSASALRDSDEGPYRVWVGSVYVDGSEGWKLAFHQHTLAGSEEHD